MFCLNRSSRTRSVENNHERILILYKLCKKPSLGPTGRPRFDVEIIMKRRSVSSITSGYNVPCKLSIPLLHLLFLCVCVASHELNRERSPSNTIHHLIDGHFWKSCQNKTRPSTPIPSEAMSFVGCQNEQKKSEQKLIHSDLKIDDGWKRQKNTQRRKPYEKKKLKNEITWWMNRYLIIRYTSWREAAERDRCSGTLLELSLFKQPHLLSYNFLSIRQKKKTAWDPRYNIQLY